MILTAALVGCENPFSPTILNVSGRYIGICRHTITDPPLEWDEEWRATVTQDEDDWVSIRMNKDGPSRDASLSFTLEASIDSNGVVDAPMPNGGNDADCGWMEPTHSWIEFRDSVLHYELELQTDRCGTLRRDATMNRQ